MNRYPLLTIYAAISTMLAVIVGSLTVVLSFAAYLWLVDDRGSGQAAVAAIAVAVLGLLYALILGVSADVIRWMFDMVEPDRLAVDRWSGARERISHGRRKPAPRSNDSSSD